MLGYIEPLAVLLLQVWLFEIFDTSAHLCSLNVKLQMESVGTDISKLVIPFPGITAKSPENLNADLSFLSLS